MKSVVRRKIVGLFALNNNHSFYPRQVALAIDESPHAVGLELRFLCKGGLLKSAPEGGRTYYQWNEAYPFAEALQRIVAKMRERGAKEFVLLPDIAQRKRLEENLKRVLEDLKKFYDPDKVILFGSVASGAIGPHSDIDLVIIKKTTLPYFKRVRQLTELLRYDVDIDFFVYTPDEFDEVSKQKRFFRQEILKKGKIIYEKAA
ncbi:MAG: nucleotidyltransferase domain-containing protein [Deltaproteobacteria bacterium]|nr:nucleotidyltransferase domain-containing protein [Deltaproteobacteria bacterium]